MFGFFIYSLLTFDSQSPDAVAALWALQQGNLSDIRWLPCDESSKGCLQRILNNLEFVTRQVPSSI
jgi:hypothetical protein